MKSEDKFKHMLGHINVTNSSLNQECIERINAIIAEVFPEPTYPLNIEGKVKETHESILQYGKLVLTNAIHFDILQYKKIQSVAEYRNIPVVKMVLSQVRDGYDHHGILTPIILAKDSVNNMPPITAFFK